MKKADVVKLFGGQAKAARALRITRQAFFLWPNELDQKKADWVLGAALRTGKLIDLIEKTGENQGA